jgi:hypothetical protein
LLACKSREPRSRYCFAGGAGRSTTISSGGISRDAHAFVQETGIAGGIRHGLVDQRAFAADLVDINR